MKARKSIKLKQDLDKTENFAEEVYITPARIRKLNEHFRKIYYHLNYINQILGSDVTDDVKKVIKNRQVAILENIAGIYFDRMLTEGAKIIDKNIYASVIKLIKKVKGER